MTEVSTTDPIETVLHDHREDVICFDHPPGADGPPSWCCICGDHEITVSQTAHVAAALRAAGFHRDGEETPMTEAQQYDTEGISKVECLVCGHFEIDRLSIEMWNGYGDCPGGRHPDHDDQWSRWTMDDGTVTEHSQKPRRS